jgi:hypothetical protein
VGWGINVWLVRIVRVSEECEFHAGGGDLIVLRLTLYILHCVAEKVCSGVTRSEDDCRCRSKPFLKSKCRSLEELSPEQKV